MRYFNLHLEMADNRGRGWPVSDTAEHNVFHCASFHLMLYYYRDYVGIGQPYNPASTTSNKWNFSPPTVLFGPSPSVPDPPFTAAICQFAVSLLTDQKRVIACRHIFRSGAFRVGLKFIFCIFHNSAFSDAATFATRSRIYLSMSLTTLWAVCRNASGIAMHLPASLQAP